jgi:hypothetical protein
MRDLIPKKYEYYKAFADVVQKKFMQKRFGVKSCSVEGDIEMAWIRKQIVDWQQNHDGGALSDVSINYSTSLDVVFDPDTTYPGVLFDSLSGGSGTIQENSCSMPPRSFQINYPHGLTKDNIIEVNTDGCITKINLNPAVNIDGGGTFTFTQSTPSTIWIIQHNLGFIPNVFTRNLSGGVIRGMIVPVDTNNLEIHFSSAVAGTANLS